MTELEIQNHYDLIFENYQKHLLEAKGVILPKLKNAKGEYIKDALVLVRLAKNYPKTEIVSKNELTNFVKKFYLNINDVQQARHLAMQKGWNIVSGTRGDNNADGIPSGSYKLISLENPYPAFRSDRRSGFTGDFDDLKNKYNYRCAACGSQEGEEHLFRKGVIVKLQEGHMNPSEPLQEGNIIPQCQICNRGDRNRWIYDKTGRVIEIAETPDGIRIVERFLKKASAKIKSQIFDFLKSIVK